MSDFWTALALVLVIEGAAWALFPDQMRNMALKAQELTPSTLRIGGLVAACFGVAMVWAIRG
ncbi:MAG: DUF2065 domain-containing protein [Alphaproteobacteria bacterium]|nr:DUF2065 domain-containing protein [Alphaproteobacteria bacterium]